MAINGWFGRNNFIGMWRSLPFTGPPHPADGAKDAWRVAFGPAATVALAGTLVVEIAEDVGEGFPLWLTVSGWVLGLVGVFGFLMPAGTLYLFMWPRFLVPPVLRGQPGHVRVWIDQWRHRGSADGRHEA